eukprot:TRINITY_DN2113_c0_g1_i1.p1 TRINITY_DN2113_c0_g1~~TRINITY_DN2113_c0_g1_i1.p1  ORF type:complete len:282 (+),score=63.41 TRINITY_DN2113_c0_g1_i1:112-846(+)
MTMVLSVLVSLTKMEPVFSFQNLKQVFHDYQFWRLITHKLYFTNLAEILFGINLLFYFRMFERQMGSSKFTFFVLYCYLMGEVLEFLGIALLSFLPTNTNKTKMLAKYGPFYCSGPYSLIFTEFVLYYYQTPTLYNFKLFNTIWITNKTFIYVIGLQLFLMKIPSLIIILLSSVFMGVLYHSKLFNISRFKMPSFFDNFVLGEKSSAQNVVPSATFNRPLLQRHSLDDSSDSDDSVNIIIEERN